MTLSPAREASAEPGRQPPAALQAPAAPAPVPVRARLGEELPIFCEKCGYSLHGLPQSRCERCGILQYACPECNHHQPINTLRPAFQRILGRLRAFALGFWVLVKLNFFGWLLFAWGAMGMEWSFQGRWIPNPAPPGQPGAGGGRMQYDARLLDLDAVMAFGIFAFLFGLFSRMLLLRWRRGAFVGLVLGVLVGLAVSLGAYLQYVDVSRWDQRAVPSPFQRDLFLLIGLAGGLVVLGAVVVWPVWLSLVHLFLPKKTGQALLDWQRSLSGLGPKKEPALAD